MKRSFTCLGNSDYSLVNNFENTLVVRMGFAQLLSPRSHQVYEQKNKAPLCVRLIMKIIVVNSNIFLLSTPSSLSVNRLERIPSRVFYKVNPSKYHALWVLAISALSHVIDHHYIFSDSYWFKLVTWRDSVHPRRDNISPLCPFAENTRMDNFPVS